MRQIAGARVQRRPRMRSKRNPGYIATIGMKSCKDEVMRPTDCAHYSARGEDFVLTPPVRAFFISPFQGSCLHVNSYPGLRFGRVRGLRSPGASAISAFQAELRDRSVAVWVARSKCCGLGCAIKVLWCEWVGFRAGAALGVRFPNLCIRKGWGTRAGMPTLGVGMAPDMH